MVDRENLVGELETLVPRGRWGEACGSFGAYHVKARALADVAYEVFARGPFGWFGDTIWCFNGHVYEKCDPDVFKWVVSELLRRTGVDVSIRVYIKEIIDSVKLAIKLERELKPRFDLQAYSNGVVDLKTGEIKGFSSQWDVLYLHDYPFEPDADCPIWKSFLRQILPEKNSRTILQMFMGLLTMDRVGEPLCLALYGKSVYGKSVVCEVLRKLCGSDNVSSVGIEYILKNGDVGLRNRTRLLGKQLNFCSKMDEETVLYNETEFLNYLSGHDVRARFSRGLEFSLGSVPWQVFNFDHLPVRDDRGTGVFSRLVYLIFDECISDKDANFSIGEELRQELPGILNWCIRGAKYLRLHQFRFPSSTNSERQRIVEIGRDDSPKAWFMFVKPSMRPRMAGDKYRWVPVKYLFAHYVRFCKENGFKPVSNIAFGRRIVDYGFVGACRKTTAKGVEVKVYGFSEDTEINGTVNLESWRVTSDVEFEDITEL